MSPTLQDLDVLYCIINKKMIRPGDIVVIDGLKHEQKIIHRVTSVGNEGIRTMGDCNPHPDSWLLKPDQILGSVAYGYRGRKRFRVLGGPAGLAKMYLVRLTRPVIKALLPMLSAILYCIPISGLISLLIRPKLIVFKRPNGNELQLMALGRVIGRQLPGQKWQIKPLFKFFLDECSPPN